jgi:sporulation protein YlmC with PRC-barrel domain
MNTKTLLATAAALGLTAGLAAAQETQPGQEMATQCLEDLRVFGQRIQEDGYWLTGIRDRWGTAGWGGAATGTGMGYYPGVGVPGDPAMNPAVPAGDAPAAEDPVMAEGAAPQVWGLGLRSPGVQIETLFRAAQVLAVEGRQEGCETVRAELETLYDDYAMQLREAGVEPGQVTTWRRDMLLTAQPVTELDLSRVSVDQVTGTEVRNLQDEYLGDVDDVVVMGGQVEHVVISRGGFLGLGEDYVVVPWDSLRATPGFAMMLLDVPQDMLDQAPQVSGDLSALSEAQVSEVRDFWQQAGQQ